MKEAIRDKVLNGLEAAFKNINEMFDKEHHQFISSDELTERLIIKLTVRINKLYEDSMSK